MNQNKTPTVVSIINLKGGVGKTTVAVLLARHAAKHGLNVLAVDLDPQANLSQALLERGYKTFMDQKDPSIVELFKGYIPSSKDKLGPSGLGAENIVRLVSKHTVFKRTGQHVSYGPVDSTCRLEILPSRFDFSHNLIGPFRVDQTILAKFISQEMAHVDLVIIDCAPTESILTTTAYHASRYIFIPVKPELFSTVGFPLMKESLDQFRAQNHGNEIEVRGVLINHPDYGHNSDHREFLADIRHYAADYGWPMLQKEMSYSRGYPKYMASSHPSRPGKAQDEYPVFCDEILQSMGF